jgi:undecaprenyl-diphosphatase
LRWLSALAGAFGVSLVCLVGFAWVAYGVETGSLSGFDRFVIRLVQGTETEPLTKAMEAVSLIGSTKPVTAIALTIMAILFFALGHRKELILFVIALVGSTVLNSVLKNLFERERPSLHRLVEVAGYSFPSGHSMAAISLYGATAYLLWRHIANRTGRALLIAAAAIVVAAIGFSRIYLGVHYPSDVLGAYLISGCWLAVSIGVFRRLAESRNQAASARTLT